MKTKVLITGVSGFVGSHLAEFLLHNFSDRVEIYGITRWRSKIENIAHIIDKIKLYECDITDFPSVLSIIEEIRPDKIFHLAAQSFVPTSWKLPVETFNTNVIGQINIFEAVRHVRRVDETFIQVAGSSEEYGLVYHDELPIKETNPLRPLSPYAVSKVAQDLLGYQYYMSYRMNIIRTRAFNHEGPRRGEVFVTSNFAKQIAEAEKGLREKVIYVGNLEARRDYTDVRDIVRAYWLALERGQPGDVYNICSGRSYSIREVLEILLSYAKVKLEVVQDKERLRPSDVPILLGDYSKFNKLTGWNPEIPFEKTLEDLLNWWREHIRQ